MYGKPGLSSINFALNSLKHKIGSFVSEKLDSLLLEGEMIAFKRKEIFGEKGKKVAVEEDILVNLGSSNGVRIGDLLQVHVVALELKDPYTANDLGGCLCEDQSHSNIADLGWYSKSQAAGWKEF